METKGGLSERGKQRRWRVMYRRRREKEGEGVKGGSMCSCRLNIVPSSILSLSLLLADSGVLWDLERCVFHHLMKCKGADDGLTKKSV